MTFVKKHWQGDYSLNISFWVNYVLVSFVIGFLFSALLLCVVQSGQTAGIQRYFMNYYLVGFVVALWQAVGVYRASVRYEKNTGKKLFPWVARTLTLFSAGHTLLSFMAVLTMSPAAYQELINRVEMLTRL